MKLTIKDSADKSAPLQAMNQLAKQLDVEYLSEALKQMREVHSWRDSAAVLNPSPFTHNEQQDLNAAKQEQLSLFIQLAKNLQLIKELTNKLDAAKENVNGLKQLFQS